MDHIKVRDSNLSFQRSIKKYGLNNFKLVIYYFHKDPAVLLTDVETSVIAAFSFYAKARKPLFNLKKRLIQC